MKLSPLCDTRIHTLAPLLGPIGAGLGLASSAMAAAGAAAGGGGAASSEAAARITNLLEMGLGFLGKKATEVNLEEDDMVVEDGITTPEAMHERLVAAMAKISLSKTSLKGNGFLGV